MSEGQLIQEEQSANDAVLALLNNSQSKYADDAAISVVTTVGDFFPYIQLMGSNSDAVKRNKFPMGHFALVKNKTPIDLGDSFVSLLLSWRAKAMIYKPEVKSFYDHNNQAFKDIEEAAKQPNSNKGFGAEFLIWLPEHQCIATYFLGNASGRMEAPNLIDCLKRGSKVCRITAAFVEKKGTSYSWYAPKMQPYDLKIQFPTIDQIGKQLEKFNNPPESENELVEEVESRG